MVSHRRNAMIFFLKIFTHFFSVDFCLGEEMPAMCFLSWESKPGKGSPSLSLNNPLFKGHLEETWHCNLKFPSPGGG